MQSLEQSLETILNVWQQDREELIELLQPGISREQIQLQMSDLSFQLPEEVYDLYGWKNGVRQDTFPDFTIEFLPGFNFPSFEEALVDFRRVEEYRHQVISFEGENASRPWFPVFSIDVQHLIVFGDTTISTASPIYYLSNCGQPLQMAYPSLTSLLSIVAECYETGAYYFETQVIEDSSFGYTMEHLSEDSHKVAQIKRNHNLSKDYLGM